MEKMNTMTTINISRGIFSGGRSLAKCVTGKPDYRYLCREVLVEAAREYGVPSVKEVKSQMRMRLAGVTAVKIDEN